MKRPEDVTLFFTAFEPSGDDHASAVIRELRSRHPDMKIWAWGGPKMEAAGATIIRGAIDDAVVGVPGLKKINEHLSYNRKINRWLAKHEVDVHIPVDSPAANFPICKLTRERGIKVVHLVAPQLWAWGAWRIRKLARLTDHVLCLLPFEQDWFERRGVSATFVGHPVFDETPDLSMPPEVVDEFPTGEPRLAVLPGSRPAEIKHNWPLLLAAYRELKRRRPSLCGVVGATTPAVADRLRQMAERTGGWPDDLSLVVSRTAPVIEWCDVALAVSGTVTLQIARQLKPMIVLYRTNPLAYHAVGRWIIETKMFSLPNVIAGRRIIPELVPYFGGPGRLVEEADKLLSDPDAQAEQRAQLQRLCALFHGKTAAVVAADTIEKIAGLEIDHRGSAVDLRVHTRRPARTPAPEA